jgi:hypothetical protein
MKGADRHGRVRPVGERISSICTPVRHSRRRSPFLTIQDAIDAAGPTEVICPTASTLAATSFDMSARSGPNDVRPLMIRSRRPERCIIDASGCVQASSSMQRDPTVVRGITIRNGLAAGAGGAAQNGGGIFITSASPTIDNCRILFCEATGNGGGIAVANGSPVIQNTWISATGPQASAAVSTAGAPPSNQLPVHVPCFSAAPIFL